MPINRRDFLEITTGSLLAGVAGCQTLERGYPEKYEVEKPPVPGADAYERGEERYKKSVCLQCPGGCGISVRVVEGRAVKIDGNRDYPTNQGGLCPKGQNGLQVLYDPDRIRGPLARDGERGAGKWRRVSWDEALGRVAAELAALRERGESHRLAMVLGRCRGSMRDLIRRFLAAYGSPNEIDNESLCASGEVASYLAHGVRERLAYDWEHARYVMSFGAGLIESFVPTAMMLRVFGQLRAGRPGQRAKIVQVEPRCGVSAARADEWVCLRPGTDAALALGLAHVLIRDRLYDTRFVRDRTLGFDAWTDARGVRHRGWRDLVMERDAGEWSRIAGVPVRTVERLAHELVEHGPAIVVSGRGVAAHGHGVYACLAVNALNALTGSFGRPGGVSVQEPPPFSPLPPPERDAAALCGAARPRFDLAGADTPPFARSQLASLAERIESGHPYPLAAAFFYYTNPLFSAADPGRMQAALARVPLLVSFSPFLDETSAFCDLVLPDHTYLERWQLDEVPPSIGFPAFGLRQPVVEPLHDTRSTGDALVAIARRIGGSVGRSFAAGEREMIEHAVRGVHESGRGSIREPSFDAFWKRLGEAGGWWDRRNVFDDPSRVLTTASRRYELYSTRLADELTKLARRRGVAEAGAGEGTATFASTRESARRGASSAATKVPADGGAALAETLAALGIAARGDDAFLPHHEPVLAGDPAYPFVLITYKTMTHAEGRGANQPHLQELYGVQFDTCWGPWVELHPADAAACGIREGDRVTLRSSAGALTGRAVLHDGLCRGVVSVPHEYGHTAYGRWAAGRGDNANRLLPQAQDRLVGGLARFDARVAVSKA